MLRFLLTALAALLASPALAHSGHGASAGFLSGIIHPIFGLDHLIAMLAVGAWAALSGGRFRAILPVAFLVSMLSGAAAAHANLPFFRVEHVILASLVVLGLLIAFFVRPPLTLAVALLAVFGAAHGYAHGVETPPDAALAFTTGFGLATAALHALGLAGASILARISPNVAYRSIGLFTFGAGLALAYAA